MGISVITTLLQMLFYLGLSYLHALPMVWHPVSTTLFGQSYYPERPAAYVCLSLAHVQ